MTTQQFKEFVDLLQQWANQQAAQKKPSRDEIAAWFYGKDE
ncbi:hypothetical protein [Mesorhizobium sp. M8A.F.Ca.ET.165.01.1.1]|nr:hypothetical protein [Mesorhizobium sp. M8A.F.Ca.ET.165.01.1.1]